MKQKEGKHYKLDANDSLNTELGKKYHVPSMIIAYLRAALMRPDKKYNKNSLIDHILKENTERRREILKLENSLNTQNEVARKEHLAAIRNKLTMRDTALVVLQNVKDDELNDILQHI